MHVGSSRRTGQRNCSLRLPVSGARRGGCDRQHRHYRPASGRTSVPSTLTVREELRLAIDPRRWMSGVVCMRETEAEAVPAVPESLPRALAGQFEDLDEAELRAAFEYSRSLLRLRHDNQYRRELHERQDRIRRNENDDRLAMKEALPCNDDCEDCPNGLYLYRIICDDGDDHRQRELIGKIEGRTSVGQRS